MSITIVKIQPSKVNHHWARLRAGLRKVLPPVVWESDRRLNHILSSVLSGLLEVYICIEGEDNKYYPSYCLFINYILDGPSMCKALQVYAYFPLSDIEPSEESLGRGLYIVKKLALSKGCAKIIAATRSRRIVEMVESAGGHAEAILLTIDVESTILEQEEAICNGQIR